MTAKDQTQWNDDNLIKSLLHPENISPLEHLLDLQSQQLRQLKQQKHPPGQKVKSTELEELFFNISSDVNEFLEITPQSYPKIAFTNLMNPLLNNAMEKMIGVPLIISYGIALNSVITYLIDISSRQPTHLDNSSLLVPLIGFSLTKIMHNWANQSVVGYDSEEKKITVNNPHRIDLIPTIAHEYTHHLQGQQGYSQYGHQICKEGHARGVERKIAEIYAQTEDNNAFLLDITDTTIGELKSTYRWLCTKTKSIPNKNLLATKTIRDLDETCNRAIERFPTSHALGNTFFSIYELTHGREIYKELLQD